jgi:creatinine amidohydrolase/Fe(II)-dependent formamide hydrolase-like protein
MSVKTVGSTAIVLLIVSGFATARDLTLNEVKAAISGGKTTLIVYVGGVHENQEGDTPGEFSGGPGHDAVAIGKHNVISLYLARRIAETLGNALAYAPFPHAPMDGNKGGGTVNLRKETFEAVMRDIVTSAATPPPEGSGFKYIVLLGDHGGTGQKVLQTVAEDSERARSARGVHVFYFPVYAEAKKAEDLYLATLPGAPKACQDASKPGMCQIEADDLSEMLFIDKEHKWVRKDKMGSLAKLVSPELGKVFIEQKIKIAVDHIRDAVGGVSKDD